MSDKPYHSQYRQGNKNKAVLKRLRKLKKLNLGSKSPSNRLDKLIDIMYEIASPLGDKYNHE